MVIELARIHESAQAPLLNAAELNAMACLLARAFLRHRNWVVVIPEEDRRRALLTHFFRFMGAVIQEAGILVVVGNRADPLGYITFLPSSDTQGISLSRLIRARALRYALRFAFGLRPRELASMSRFSRAVSRHRSDLDRATTAHLYFTGIDPQSMGKGIMRRAFAQSEAFLHQAGYTAYELETTDPGNLPVYDRFGLTVVSESVLPNSERKIWFLERHLTGDATASDTR